MSGIAASLGPALGLGTLTGLNLYMMILFVGVVVRLDLFAEATRAHLEHLEFLGATPVLIAAFVLVVLEGLASKSKLLKSFKHFWDVAHTVVKPLATGVIALMSVGHSTELAVGMGVPVQALGMVRSAKGLSGLLGDAGAAVGGMSPVAIVVYVLAAVAACVLVHLVRFCAHFAIWLSPFPFLDAVISTVEDLVVVGLIALFVFSPGVAIGICLVLLMLAMLLLARALRFQTFIMTFVARWWSHLLRRPGPGLAEHPAGSLARKIESLAGGDPPALCMATAVRKCPGISRFRRGYLLVVDDEILFVYRTLLRPRVKPLPMSQLDERRLIKGILFPRLQLGSGKKANVFFVYRDLLPQLDDLCACLGAELPAAPPSLVRQSATWAAGLRTS